MIYREIVDVLGFLVVRSGNAHIFDLLTLRHEEGLREGGDNGDGAFI
jgi:hypothetical protein